MKALDRFLLLLHSFGQHNSLKVAYYLLTVAYGIAVVVTVIVKTERWPHTRRGTELIGADTTLYRRFWQV